MSFSKGQYTIRFDSQLWNFTPTDYYDNSDVKEGTINKGSNATYTLIQDNVYFMLMSTIQHNDSIGVGYGRLLHTTYPILYTGYDTSTRQGKRAYNEIDLTASDFSDPTKFNEWFPNGLTIKMNLENWRQQPIDNVIEDFLTNRFFTDYQTLYGNMYNNPQTYTEMLNNAYLHTIPYTRSTPWKMTLSNVHDVFTFLSTNTSIANYVVPSNAKLFISNRCKGLLDVPIYKMYDADYVFNQSHEGLNYSLKFNLDNLDGKSIMLLDQILVYPSTTNRVKFSSLLSVEEEGVGLVDCVSPVPIWSFDIQTEAIGRYLKSFVGELLEMSDDEIEANNYFTKGGDEDVKWRVNVSDTDKPLPSFEIIGEEEVYSKISTTKGSILAHIGDPFSTFDRTWTNTDILMPYYYKDNYFTIYSRLYPEEASLIDIDNIATIEMLPPITLRFHLFNNAITPRYKSNEGIVVLYPNGIVQSFDPNIDVIVTPELDDERDIIPFENEEYKPIEVVSEEITPTTPYSTIGKGTITYCMNDEAIKQFLNKIWGWGEGTSIQSIEDVKKINSSPIENIVSLKMLPFAIEEGSFHNGIFIGDLSVPILTPGPESHSGYWVTHNYEVTLGEIDIEPYYKNFLDYSPYTKITIYLPFIGYHELDSSIYMGKKLKVKYYVDVITGMCQAVVSANDIPTNAYDGQMGIDLSINGNNRGQLEAGFIQSALGATSSLAIGAMTGNTGMVIGSAINGSVGMINSAIAPFHTEQKGAFSSSIGAMINRSCYVIIEIPTWQDSKLFNHTMGRPTMLSRNLNSLKGFTVVDSNIDLQGLSCTEEEKNELKNILNSGFYL